MFSKKGDCAVSSSASSQSSASTASLCPIPQNGLPAAASVILWVLLLLATVSFGVGLTSLRTTSETEIRIATALAIASLILLTLHLWRVARPMRGVLLLLAILGLFLSYQTHSPVHIAMILSILFIAGEGSLLLATARKRLFLSLPVLLLVAYAATVLLSRDLLGSVAVLVPWPASLVLAWQTRRAAEKEDGPTRVGIICTTAAVLGFSLLAMVALSVYRQIGSLSPQVLMDSLDGLRESAIQKILAQEVPPDTPDSIKNLLTYANAENLVNSVINLLPGFCLAVVAVLAAIAQLILLAALHTFGYGESVTDRVKLYHLSTIACICFTAAYFTALLSGSSDSTLASTVAQNIYIALLPGMTLAGFLRLTQLLARRGRGGMGCLFILVFLVPCLLPVAPLLLPLVEIIGRFYSWVIRMIRPPDES